MTKQPSQICGWDFTLPFDASIFDVDVFSELLDKHCKKWAFQVEKGAETGYEHIQGRISLKVKSRLPGVKNWLGDKVHLSPTSKANADNMFYVLKEDTRIDGPWTSENYEKIYIPRQIRDIAKLYPWQEDLKDLSCKWDTRHIDYIFDPVGNHGKSIYTMYMGSYRHANIILFVNNFKDMLRMVMDMPVRGCYIMDMPRAIGKEHLQQLYSAIECVKNGYAYDDRYKFKCRYFDCPNIQVFGNVMPDLAMLSVDRWRIWTISEDKQLVRFKLPQPQLNLIALTK